jgi:hypothetical protein
MLRKQSAQGGWLSFRVGAPSMPSPVHAPDIVGSLDRISVHSAAERQRPTRLCSKGNVVTVTNLLSLTIATESPGAKNFSLNARPIWPSPATLCANNLLDGRSPVRSNGRHGSYFCHRNPSHRLAARKYACHQAHTPIARGSISLRLEHPAERTQVRDQSRAEGRRMSGKLRQALFRIFAIPPFGRIMDL